MAARNVLGIAAIVLLALLSSGCLRLVWDILDVPVPCYDEDFERCQEAQDELQPIAQDSCAGDGKRVCLVPLGQVSPELMQQLVGHYEEQYGLTVTVLRPLAIPDLVVNSDRGQLEGGALLGFMRGTFPDESADPNVVLIGLTPLDMYTKERDWRFAFGVKGVVADPKAVISTFRMNPQTFGDFPDDGLLFSRAQKMVSRYIGFFYYRLPANSDSESLLYSSILSLGDLDRLQGPLPVTQHP